MIEGPHEAVATVSERISWVGAAGGAWGWIISSDGVMYLSFVVALLASAYSIWRRRKKARMVEAEHELRMRMMEETRANNRELHAAQMRAVALGDITGAEAMQPPGTSEELEQ